MALYFFDTSALVKRYVNETGSAWVESIADPALGNEVFVARITELEFTSAVVRRAKGGSVASTTATSVLAQFRQDCANEYQIIELVPALVSAAIRLIETHALRANDGIQLAAILALHAERRSASLLAATLVSSDDELNAAATAEGLTVENPIAHP